MYHGWADPLVTPDASLIMFKRINDAVGPSAASSLALFMVPGMGHCQGGPGTDVFDKAAAIDQWVESGKKPQSIVAAHIDRHGVVRSHASAVRVSDDSALHRQRQHRRCEEFSVSVGGRSAREVPDSSLTEGSGYRRNIDRQLPLEGWTSPETTVREWPVPLR